MSKEMTWEEYADELKVRLDNKTAECDKVKQQLAIAVKALEYYKDKKTWCLCEKSQCAYVDGMTADLALKKIKELENA